MADKKFAFESGKVSLAFLLSDGLGDCVIACKVFDALVELAPDCLIDIFCSSEFQSTAAKAFYSDRKNFNLILSYGDLEKLVKNYDLALWTLGSHAIILRWANAYRLQTAAPKIFNAVIKIDQYNQKNVYGITPLGTSMAFRNMMMARILNKNCFEFLSCDGALPIHDDKVTIALHPEYKGAFDALKLEKYITFYTDINNKERERPKVKAWSIRYWYEYVIRMKQRFPAVEIIQCGGKDDVRIENADRNFMGVDLELTKYILANSLLHVGCEGGLIHLATALGAKCLVLFGQSSVYYYGYKQNINLVSEVCQPCMYISQDFTKCLRGDREPPCMLSHTPQLVCEVTCNYLKNKA